MAGSEVRRFEVWGIAIAAVVILGVLPALNAFVPETNPLHVSNFTINLYGKYLTYAVLAIGVDVLWGFTGLLSLGQCLFFALGGYAFGMYLMLKIGKLGQYKSDLPDFMVFLGYNKLPAHWVPVQQLLVCLGGGRSRPGHCRVCLRISRLSLAHPWRLFFHPDAGSHLRRLSDVLSERLYLRRQQWPDRFQVRAEL